jgi:hypothetical protein
LAVGRSAASHCSGDRWSPAAAVRHAATQHRRPRSAAGGPPVGHVAIDDEVTIEQLFRLQASLPAAKLCAVIDTKLGAYNLTIEVETPFHPDTLQLDEAISALERCVLTADRVTRELLSPDESMSTPDPPKDVVRG